MKQWYFNEMHHPGVNFSNVEEVEIYDQKQRHNSEEEKELLLRLGLTFENTLIEFGPGTGILSREAAKLCKKVIVVDVSKPMLDFIKRKAQEEEIHNIEYHHRGFLSYLHTGEMVDFIVSKFALHHLPDFWKMKFFHHSSKFLKPGGFFYLKDVIFSFPPEETEAHIERWINTMIEASGWSREEFEMHVKQEHSTYSWVIEEMLERSGFSIRERHYDPLQTYAEYICIKH